MRYLILLLLLTGCVTQEQRAERDIARYAPYCEKLGYERDSEEWRQCIMKKSEIPVGTYQPKHQHCTSYGNQVVCQSY